MSSERVLFVHNAYQQAGGEDSVVDDEIALLRDRGHDVFEMRRDNHEIEDISRASLALQALWSTHTHRQTVAEIERHRPDVVHVHNTLPLVSPSVFWACAQAGVPVVQTLHNFRIACPQAMFLRDGRVCESCIGRVPLPALRHGCYRDSRVQTAIVVGMFSLHRGLGTWRNKVTRYIALNEFCRTKFVQAGLPAERIVVKPNFAKADGGETPGPRHGFLFVGRLSPEKGIDVLARAWDECCGMSLAVAGTGSAAGLLENRVGVTLLGSLSQPQVRGAMQRAIALVMPSLWYENFPRTLVEAFGAGLPVIASRLGAMAELIEPGITGLLFEPGDAQDLAEVLRWAQQHPDRMAEMGRNARQRFNERYTADINYPRLLEIYRSAIDEPNPARSCHV